MIASELRRSGSFKTQFDNKSQVSTQGEQSLDFPSCQSFNFTHDKQRHRKTVGCKVKSSLCKNFTSTGNCPYGNKCQFAHGAHELRINEDTNSSYKTKECNSYFKKGYCQYGYRCNFLHSIKEEPCLRSESKNSLNNDDWKDVFEYVRLNESSKLMKLLQ